MRHGTRRNGPSKDAIPEVARRLAEKLGKSVEDFRYLEIRFHDGKQWTVVAYWEQRTSEGWQVVDWTDLVL